MASAGRVARLRLLWGGPLGGLARPTPRRGADASGGALRWRRFQVSLAAVLQKAENVMPCYTMVKHQLKPQVVEEPRAGQAGSEFAHAVTWQWEGKEISVQGTGRRKQVARNAAARDLLLRLTVEESDLMNPMKNGTVAQWAIEWLNERLQATLEQQDDPAAAEGQEEEAAEGGRQPHSQIWTWSCPQVEGETVVRSSARTSAESRRQAMAELFGLLPAEVERAVDGLGAAEASPRPAGAVAGSDREDLSRITIMHNAVVQKLGVVSRHTFKTLPSGEFECTLQWQFFDGTRQVSEESRATARTKAIAKATVSEQMLVDRGHLPPRSEEFKGGCARIREALASGRVGDAVAGAHGLIEGPASDPLGWVFFLPEVLQAALAENDQGAVSSLLSSALGRCREGGGMPPLLWEALLDEASYAMRHYHCAQTALEMLAGVPLVESSLPGPPEAEYFQRFRHLMALERHGGLLHGISQYEVDTEVSASIPVAEVHRLQSTQVTLTSTPQLGALELMQGNRPLKESDIVLFVPNEVLPEAPAEQPQEGIFGESLPSRSTNWQHPEAWLGEITSVRGGAPRHGEELMFNVRRISRFGSDAMQCEEGALPTSPLALGRQYSVFLIAMETPTARALAAVRSLTRVQLPPWSHDFEGRKPSYHYDEAMRKLLTASPEESHALAVERPRTAAPEAGTATLDRLIHRHAWCAALTPSQRGAVEKALQQRLSLIQGPPGTGKTYVACSIVAAWLESCMPGERILVVADSNVAVDNLYARMQQFGIDAVRVGMGKEVETLVGDQLWQRVKNAQVIVATCIGSGMDVLNSKGGVGNFQRVVIDECTQACEPAALVALGRGCEQAVLVGDHAQLPATVLSKLAQRDGLGTSLFERMVSTNGLEPTLLSEQRRMHSTIAEFPNQAFYGSQLVNAVDDGSLPPIPGFRWPNPDCRVCFVDVASDAEAKRGFSTFNTTEAEAIADAVRNFIDAGLEPREFCVLTPYQAQRAEILRALRAQGLGHLLGVLSVDTVDAYQGMERDLVLFSATRSNSDRSLGFLADARRMNVMLTRARRGLIVFGNADTLRHTQAAASHWAAWLEWAEGKGSLVSHESLRLGGAGGMAAQELGPAGGGALPAASPAEPAVGLAAPPPPPPPPAATAWEKVWSEEYQRHYFWDKATNATQWEAPAGLGP